MTAPIQTARSLAYWQSVDEVIAELGTDRHAGLTSSEACSRLGQYGPNELATEPPVAAWRRFLAQFSNILIILHLIATAISAAFWLIERESALPYEAIAILSVVLLNAILIRFRA